MTNALSTTELLGFAIFFIIIIMNQWLIIYRTEKLMNIIINANCEKCNNESRKVTQIYYGATYDSLKLECGHEIIKMKWK